MEGYPEGRESRGNYKRFEPPPIGFDLNMQDIPTTTNSAYLPSADNSAVVYRSPYEPSHPQPPGVEPSGIASSNSEVGFSLNSNELTVNPSSVVNLDNTMNPSAFRPESEGEESLRGDTHPLSLSTSGYRVQERTQHARSQFFDDGLRKIDFVLCYDETSKDTEKEKKREQFERNLVKIGLQIEKTNIEASQDQTTIYVKVHAPWEILIQGAEEMMMKMPIRENDIEPLSLSEKCFECLHINNPFELNAEDLPEEPNYFTAVFRKDRIDRFIMTDKDSFFSSSQRTLIVHRILMKTRYGVGKNRIGIRRLIANGSYSAAYPLHEGKWRMENSILTHSPENDRQLLFQTWVRPIRWYKQQPLDLIRNYFGEKIGIYFAWLGFYTTMLVPAAFVGLFCIIYGIVTLEDYQPVKDICNEETKYNYPMCPRCDQKCTYWALYDTCLYSQVAYVFDNEFTVIFSIFMSLWATMFLEFWKRKQVEIAYEWDLLNFEEEEEQSRPEYEAAAADIRINPITQVEEPFFSTWRRVPRHCCTWTTVVFWVCIVVCLVFGVVLYRIAVAASFYAIHNISYGQISILASSSAACINLVLILIMNKVYEKLALALTGWEMPRTQTAFEDNFSFKMYLFQFVNYYASLFYIAFAKLNPGRPGDYNRIFGYRREECNPAGCLFELFLQLAIVMVGKQLWSNSMEILRPKFMNWLRKRRNVEESVDVSSMPQWEQDFILSPMETYSLFYEYLEMVIQYGFITLFVAAFPLGPFFALVNNLLEIRLDAYKFITTFRRPVAYRAQDIGIWYPILKGVTIFSVVVNGFVIAFVSEFVPRLYYRWAVMHSKSLEGFVNYSLSCFIVSDFDDDNKPTSTLGELGFTNDSCQFGLPTCRFRGFYENAFLFVKNMTITNPNAYKFSTAYWHVLAGRLFFIVVFLHLVFGVTALVAYLIPDVPRQVDNQIKREAFLAREALRVQNIETDINESRTQLRTSLNNDNPDPVV